MVNPIYNHNPCHANAGWHPATANIEENILMLKRYGLGALPHKKIDL